MENTDVIIVGGGPAGSTLGCYLAKAGLKTTILEGANHPRPHVGESLVTSTTRVFDELGFLEVMEREGFVRKYGASWHPPRKAGQMSIKFAEFPQPGVNQDYTWHVDRSKFDLALLKHAESLGAKVVQGAKVKEVLFEDDRAVGVRADFAGQDVELKAKVVVDASGRQTLLGRQLKLVNKDKHFNQFAVHAWFENVDRGPDADEIHIHFLPVERGWVWQIPITDEITSMGVVAEAKVFREANHKHDEWFAHHIKSAPDIEAAMANARQVNDFKVEADYSYLMETFCGDGWLLIGDAARFVDPIFSSGVSVALSCAKFSSERIIKAFEENDFSKAMFQPYEEKVRRGTSIWYEFITLYYKLLPLFTKFIQSPTHRHQVLQLLQGEVYDRQEVPVLDAMRKYIAAVEATPGHLLEKALDPNLPMPDVSHIPMPEAAATEVEEPASAKNNIATRVITGAGGLLGLCAPYEACLALL
ncbi:MAG: NAD(P)/FAD-dependent oxidoreductase [Maricaulaceae bacterium]|jgi:FADH2 O2-dependent halogenase